MNYLTFDGKDAGKYPICILVNTIKKDEILRTYIQPYGLDPNDVIVISLHQAPGKKKTSTAEMKAYITTELTPIFNDLQVEYLLVGDGDYFKTFSGAVKVDAMVGYVLPSKFGDQQVAYVPNFRTVFYDPAKVTEKVALGVNALKSWIQGTYRAPGIDIIEYADYPQDVESIAAWLEKLHEWPALAVDIEGFSLKHWSAGIGTISFAWSKTQGISFPVDLLDDPAHAQVVRILLRRFFETYQGTLIYHNISYDVYVLIYQLFMEHLLDNAGLLRGLEVMLPAGRWHDTKLIAYLSLNSCVGNKLGLKQLAQEYAGNYAQEEIKDIRKIPLPALLEYNLVDSLSTWFVFDRHYDYMVHEQQLGVYQDIFQPAIADIIQMQLTGMPVNMDQVLEVEQILTVVLDDAIANMQANPLIQRYVHHLKEVHVQERNATLKKKQITISDPELDKVVFNPNSGPQLQELLFEMLGLPVLARTATKLPSTDGDTLEALTKHTKDAGILAFLDALISYKSVEKIVSSFIPALKDAQLGNDGWYYLFGSFNLGGTVSGRLSSSGPNLQNLPANVVMMLAAALIALLGDRIKLFVNDKGELHLGKLIKSCFQAPPGWHFCGIDFMSLEDRISALTTKDPNKLKVYTDGYDGHAMRAVAYFGDKMPDIDPNSVASINQLAEKGHHYGHFRQDSKAPTFALTYQGTYRTLMTNCGFTEELARSVEERYHALYKVSDDWIGAKLDLAMKVGYVAVAFGLRVRTPLLAQVIRGTSKTPFEAEAEGRTAGNACGQSWCLLNSRAGSEFMSKARQSSYRNDIKPCAQIHDAQYFLVRDDIDALVFTNEHVVKACEWQDDPEIWHPDVKLGGEFSVFWPTWANEIGIPNNASAAETYAAFEKGVEKYLKKAA